MEKTEKDGKSFGLFSSDFKCTEGFMTEMDAKYRRCIRHGGGGFASLGHVELPVLGGGYVFPHVALQVCICRRFLMFF